MRVSRRSVLGLAAGFGVSVAFTARAAEPALANRKFIAVICRGGMDGLSVSPPIGDAAYAGLRGAIAIPADAALKLDGDFALHPALASVHRLALAGQARIVPALASPDRARSHFEAQDVLETGASGVYGANTGWLNRAVGALSPGRKLEALSVGATAPLILRGPAESGVWSPGRGVDGNARLPMLLASLYAGDPLLAPALAQGLETQSMAQAAQALANGQTGTPAVVAAANQASRQLGRTVAGFMTQPGGPQVVALSVDGFDTHANQGAATGQLAGRLGALDGLLDGINTGLGPAWKDTVVVVVTEFGRTARVNGTGGTDHGTGSTGLVLGGALKPGGIIGDWPGLATLYENRDLRPTTDSRALFKGLLADHMGIEKRLLDRDVFPESAQTAGLTGLV